MREKVFTWLKYLSAFFLQAGAFAFSIESIVMALVLIEISYNLSTMCKDSTYDAHGRFGLFELFVNLTRKWPRRSQPAGVLISRQAFERGIPEGNAGDNYRAMVKEAQKGHEKRRSPFQFE